MTLQEEFVRMFWWSPFAGGDRGASDEGGAALRVMWTASRWKDVWLAVTGGWALLLVSWYAFGRTPESTALASRLWCGPVDELSECSLLSAVAAAGFLTALPTLATVVVETAFYCWDDYRGQLAE